MDARAMQANAQTLMVYVALSGSELGDPSSITCAVLGNADWPYLQRTFIRNEAEPPQQLIDRAVEQVRKWKSARGLEYPTLMAYRCGETQAQSAHHRVIDRAANLRAALTHLSQHHRDGAVRVAALCAHADAMEWESHD